MRLPVTTTRGSWATRGASTTARRATISTVGSVATRTVRSAACACVALKAAASVAPSIRAVVTMWPVALRFMVGSWYRWNAVSERPGTGASGLRHAAATAE
ncbi:hypothetical protein FSC37_11785 [Piscinibacter aquaticus]|uniref:Uncharacterized protein n=1 Tax=Piscinibacter aquaticus TaxID=392597 RepID=A0A5C6TZY8_9BURK|nr:hypothetical protein FSC37_11785 [Piscinibacter aquaticus]